jgi:hypothetical protein
MRISMAVLITATALAGANPGPLQEAAKMPPEARVVIDRAKMAAQRRDFGTLRSLMARDFKWNFGPDGESPELAITAWRQDPEYLQQMREVLDRGCHMTDSHSINCPGKGGLNFRGGFKKMSEGWLLNYFLAGD